MKDIKIYLMLLLAVSCLKKKWDPLQGDHEARIQVSSGLFSRISNVRLIGAALNGDIEEVRLFLSRGAEINARSAWFNLPARGSFQWPSRGRRIPNKSGGEYRSNR